MMTSREGIHRVRSRQSAPIGDQVLTPLGRVQSTMPSISNSTSINSVSSSSIPTTVVQTSGNVRVRRNLPVTNVESDSNSMVDLALLETITAIPITTFDAEQFCSDIKANGHDEKRLEQLVLNAVNYFLTTSKRSPQQIPDYTVLPFLAWAASIHGEIFRISSVLKAMCILLKGSTLTKTIKAFPAVNNGNSLGITSTPYTLVCQILWLAFKDQTHWPEEFIEAYVEDALGNQSWIKTADCHLFVSNLQTAFNTRPLTWKLDRSKIFPTIPPASTTISISSSTINDETSNDSNNTNESLSLTTTESDLPSQTIDDPMVNNTDNQLILPRYVGRHQSIQNLLQTLLTTNAKIKSTSGNSTNSSTTTTSTSTSQPHETDKLLYLLEHLCGLPDIRLYILSRLEVWLQNPKLHRTAERLMVTLCENLTKPPSTNANNPLTNGHTNNDLAYIDERAIEQLVNLRFKVLTSNVASKMYILCVREMLKNDANLVDLIVRFIVHNEFQQISSSSSSSSLITTTKNPNNLPLLHACCQSQGDPTCQSLAYTIQNILLLTNVTTTSKDYNNLLKLIRPFLRDLMRFAKNDFDATRFCMYLIDMHYSSHLQQQFWTMIQQQDPPSNDISSHRLLKRLLDCDMSTRERFLLAICDLIPMIILASAQGFNSINNATTSTTNTNPSSARSSSSTINIDQWLLFIQRISFIQCSSYLFFLYTLPRLFDSTSTINTNTYITCLYSILFTAPVSSYLSIENWPPEEPIGLRNDLFRLSSEIPLLGETLYLLIQIGLTSQFRLNPSTIIDLIDLIVKRTLNVEQKMPSDYVSIYLRLPENHCEIFLRKFFDLTRYHIPNHNQFPSTYQIPKNFSITEMFWKTCLICLLLASHHPQMFGRFIWLSVPQIRLFMEMLLTGDYTYPPKSMIETKNFLDKFYMNERVQLREEKDTILELEKYLASPNIIDERNSQLLGKIILLDLQQIKRPSSHEKNEKNFYNLIQGLNNSYKLSSMLCRCRSPDFILDILSRKEQQGKTILESQTSWLTSLIDSNIDCLNVFPIICLCDYFQHMIMIYNNKNTPIVPSKKTLQALETILLRFKSIIQFVKQQIRTNTLKSSGNVLSIDDMTCIFNYFFNCLNSNISTMRSNAWLCLYIILAESNPSIQIEHLLLQSDQLSERNIELILSSISQFKSLEKTHLLIKQILSETCQFETNIHFLHYSILFIIENCQIDSTNDSLLLINLARALSRRHSILYFLIQNDKQEKSCQLIEKYFHLMIRMLLRKLHESLKSPMEINAEENFDEQMSSTTHTFLVLPHFKQEQVNLIEQLQTSRNSHEDFQWKINPNRQYIQIESVLIELLLIFLAYLDFDHPKLQALNESANLLQEFFLHPSCKSSFTTVKQFHPPRPIKQNQEGTSEGENNHADYFKQFAIEDTTDQPENSRKRRLSSSTSSEKVFLVSSLKPIFRLVESDQSLFLSDDLQYFIFKSNNFTLVKQCIDQASFLTAMKMLKISVISRENVNHLCHHLNHLLDSSSKQIQTYVKQSSFILPLINRWILEQLPEAIQLGEKLKKVLEKKKKSHDIHHSQSLLISTSSPLITSISDQIKSIDLQINDLCIQTSSNEVSSAMDTSETNFALPWQSLKDCEEILHSLLNKDFDTIKRRQLLVQLQRLTNLSEEYRSQFLQVVFKRCQSNQKDTFRVDFHQQSNTSLVLLNILMKNNLSNPDFLTIINTLELPNTDDRSLVQMKLAEIKQTIVKSNRNSVADNRTHSPSSMEHMLDILSSHYLFKDCRIEHELSEYLKFNHQNEDQCKQLLINVLIQGEYRLSEPTIGMILDRLERIDYKSSRSSNTSIYANHLLFSQRTDSSISQRLLLKQFLHSCDWPTILHCINDLLTLPSFTKSSPLSPNASTSSHHRLIATQSVKQSRCLLLNNRDSTLILDMLEAFLKLSPLWAGREFKMLERCHEEFLIDFHEQHISTLIIYILDEGDRRYLCKANLCEQYQKRYETILYHLLQTPEKKNLFRTCLRKIFIDGENLAWTKDILTSFYLILYVNQSDLFPENFHLILPDFFSEMKQMKCLNTNYDHIIHDLLIRLNSYDLISLENYQEINLLLKQYLSKYPFLFLRHLNIIQLNLQSRLSTLTNEEFTRRTSKQRTFVLSLFDFITRLKPYIYDAIYENDFQSILDIYIRLILSHLPALNNCSKQNILSSNYLQDLIYMIDGLLNLIYNYLSSTIHNNQHYFLFKTYNNKFFEKIQEKLQMNKDLYQAFFVNKQNQILYHLKQLKMLYETIKIEDIPDSSNSSSTEIIPFDVRLCHKQSSLDSKSFNIQHYQKKLSQAIDPYTSSILIDEILITINELKTHLNHSLTVDHMKLLIPPLTNCLLNGNKQLIEQTYELLLKFIDKYPQHSLIFYSTYLKCLLSNETNVFQMAFEHFAYFIIYFQSQANELFNILLKQGLINKIDVTTSITQAIRLLNLHRYDSITYTTVPSIATAPTTITTTTND